MGGFARVMNKVPVAVLRSPLHRTMSGKYLLLSFTGRKSGRRYTIPVAYLREGDAFLMTTDSPWWKNLRGEDEAGAPVTVRVKGREYEGVGEAVTDETGVVRVLGRFLEVQPGYGKFVGLKRGAGGRVDPSKLQEAARGRVVVRVWPHEQGWQQCQLTDRSGPRTYRVVTNVVDRAKDDAGTALHCGAFELGVPRRPQQEARQWFFLCGSTLPPSPCAY